MKRLSILVFILLVPALAAQNLSKVRINFQVRIPTRDGLKLAASVYTPTNAGQAMPVLMALTPHGKDFLHNDAYWFAQHGYVVVTVDCRGRGNSEGVFIPFEAEGRDGYDICKWISRKNWCNGNIGMFGDSYLGKVQWLTLREHPPALKTIIPIASGAPGIDMPMLNNIFLSSSVQWLALTDGRTSNTQSFMDRNYWNRVYETYFKQYVPFRELPSVAGMVSTTFQKWLMHPAFDKYYLDILPNALDYKHATTTVLTITGYFDDNQRGALYFHNNLIEHVEPEMQAESYMVIGPWDRNGTRNPKTMLHNLSFGESAVLDIRELQLDWFDWKLRSKDKPGFLRNNTMYYQMGKDAWLGADSIQQLNDTTNAMFLHPADDKRNTLYNPGILSSSPGGLARPTEIHYDPLDTSMTQYRLLDHPVDYSWREKTEALFPEKAVFQSEQLDKRITICGQIELKAFISLNVPDTDLEAILYEIRPDGAVIYISSDVMRARYRNSLKRAELIRSKDVQEYHFKSFHYTCRTIPPGSRLRLVFGALNSPYFQKNYNAGKKVHLESDRVARRALIKLYHGKKFPSALILPVTK